jgi:hypothetical protein
MIPIGQDVGTIFVPDYCRRCDCLAMKSKSHGSAIGQAGGSVDVERTRQARTQLGDLVLGLPYVGVTRRAWRKVAASGASRSVV